MGDPMGDDWVDDDPIRLFPLFVTSEAVTPELIDEFLTISEDNIPWVRDDDDDSYIFSLMRTSTDAATELERLHKRGKVTGARPHTTAHEHLDFKKAKVMTLANYVISNFSKPGKYPSSHGPMEDAFFLILDERSARDKTCLMVEIPYKEEENEDGDMTFYWKLRTRKYYTDDRNWDDELEHDGPDDLRAVRCPFDLAWQVQNLASRYGPQSIDQIYEICEDKVQDIALPSSA